MSDFEIKLRNFLNPDNPFLPWSLLISLVILLVHIVLVYWVYRDALYRYNRGAPWAFFAAIFPVGGWLFYLMYRISPLVQFDRIEADLFDEDEHEWTDYDQYRANRSANAFRELSNVFRKKEGSGYSPRIRLSRMRELRKTLSPEDKKARAEQRRSEREERLKAKAEKRTERIEARKQRKQDQKERTTMVAAHGFKFKMSDRRQQRVKKDLEVMEQLKQLPRMDQMLEEMIYEMDYKGALEVARDNREVAEEMGDKQGVITYDSYISRLSRLVEEEEQPDDDTCTQA